MNKDEITFLINKSTIIHNYNNYSKTGNVYYPLKTNTNKIVLKTLIENFKNNDGFLISNLDHFNILNLLNVPSEKMCYINVLSSDDTIKYLYDKGVRFFVFDNNKSLKEFMEYANLTECRIALRLNTMEVFNDTLMHLGASTIECKEMLDELNNKCKSIGISFYLQTKVKNEKDSLERMLNHIQESFKDYNIDFLSLAGLKKYEEINTKSIDETKNIMHLKEIILEPGKYLVGDSIDIITKVIRIKRINNKNIIIIKNGIYSGLLDIVLYNEKFKLYLVDNNKYLDFSYKKDNNHDIEVYICGGSSDSGDVIGTLYISNDCFNKIKVGSDILIKDVGSYVEEFFMSYAGDIKKKYVEVDDNEI
ncbi:MAG: hypothetical protein IK137_03245 [Bacilli bacterium]|nr:hypothetical protein [Bacilli bacterium]